VALADARAAAKSRRDFAEADRLRDEIATTGWRVVDTPAGYELVAKPPFDLTSSLDALTLTLPPITAEVSVGLIIEGWWEDARSCIDSLVEHSDAVVIALDVSRDAEVGVALAEYARASAGRVHDLHLDANDGWGRQARRLLELSPAPFHVLMDPSTILDGDALAQMRAAFHDDSVVAVGWKGALVDLDDNWRSVIDRGPGEVDVLLGYLMMVRRDALLAVDLPHPKARYYRNADLELSLGLRAAGGRLLALDLPVHQERHHGYHDAEPEFRERESKRTYDRILAAYRGRDEILTPRR
jgi:GT2 family glycosyltransferase